MGHLTATPTELLVIAVISCLLIRAPIFACAYKGRKFGGAKDSYILDWSVTSLGAVLVLVLMSIAENADR